MDVTRSGEKNSSVRKGAKIGALVGAGSVLPYTVIASAAGYDMGETALGKIAGIGLGPVITAESALLRGIAGAGVGAGIGWVVSKMRRGRNSNTPSQRVRESWAARRKKYGPSGMRDKL